MSTSILNFVIISSTVRLEPLANPIISHLKLSKVPKESFKTKDYLFAFLKLSISLENVTTLAPTRYSVELPMQIDIQDCMEYSLSCKWNDQLNCIEPLSQELVCCSFL